MVYRFCMICKQHLKVDGCNTITPFWDIPEGQWWRKVVLLSGTSGSSSGCSLCLKWEMTRHANVRWFMAYDQWFDRMVRNLEYDWENLSEWVEKCEDFCVSCECSPKCDSEEKDFDKSLDRMTCSVSFNQPLSSANPVITQWTYEQVAMVKGMDGMHWLSNIEFHLPRLTWLQSLLSIQSAAEINTVSLTCTISQSDQPATQWWIHYIGLLLLWKGSVCSH